MPRKQSFTCIYIIYGSHAGHHDEYITLLLMVAFINSLLQPLNTIYKMPVGLLTSLPLFPKVILYFFRDILNTILSTFWWLIKQISQNKAKH